MSENERILVRRSGDAGWSAPEISRYSNEAHLQALLVGDPARVPGVESDAVAVAELPTLAGPIDVCIVGTDGSLTVVECKLSTNSEKRRMVIGQVLDYASAISSSGFSEFVSAWRARSGRDLDAALDAVAMDRLAENISEARINLCLAVDLIDSDLRRLVEYLNRITAAEIGVTALQLSYSKHGEVEILIPTTFGGEIVAEKARSTKTLERWTREKYLASVADDVGRDNAAQIFALSDALTERRGSHEPIWFGAFPRGGVFFHPYGLHRSPFQLWTNTKGQAMVFANWGRYSATNGDNGFRPLARLLGQDHTAAAKGVPLAQIDVSALWSVSLEVAISVNG